MSRPPRPAGCALPRHPARAPTCCPSARFAASTDPGPGRSRRRGARRAGGTPRRSARSCCGGGGARAGWTRRAARRCSARRGAPQSRAATARRARPAPARGVVRGCEAPGGGAQRRQLAGPDAGHAQASRGENQEKAGRSRKEGAAAGRGGASSAAATATTASASSTCGPVSTGPGTRCVPFVRGEGRGVSHLYGAGDEACPVSTGARGA